VIEEEGWLLTGHSGIDPKASVNEPPCFRKLRIEFTEKQTLQALIREAGFSSMWIVSVCPSSVSGKAPDAKTSDVEDEERRHLYPAQRAAGIVSCC
jgi:hypothetical protein